MAERKAFLLRISPALWAELESWAQAELRSVNGQVEYLLRQAVARRKGIPPGDATAPDARNNPQASSSRAPDSP
jgi:hypothetical protein